MFTDDKSIENIQQLFAEFKKFLCTPERIYQTGINGKVNYTLIHVNNDFSAHYLRYGSPVLSAFALAYILEPLVGGLMVSFGIIAGINVLLIAIIYFFRRQLIISPMVNFLANLFLNDSNKNEAMNNSTPTPKKITLEDIAQRKKKCCRKSVTRNKPWRIPPAEFSPPCTSASGGNALMRSFSTGMAIFDGVMLGMKMIRKVRGLFRKDIKNTRTYIIAYPGV